MLAESRSLRADQARRVALAAQGFGSGASGRSRPADASSSERSRSPGRPQLRRAMSHMGVIQIDSVNVVVRSQELPLFARLGAHRRDLIDHATASGDLFEYWVHEACHVPVADHPLWRWRMAAPHRWSGPRDIGERSPAVVADVLRRVHADGPVTVGDLRTRPKRAGSWWDWDDTKAALELLFWRGDITARRRPRDFARVYDVVERALPADVVNAPTPTRRDAHRELARRAVRHLGVATLDDIADYHRLRTAEVRDVLADLVESGEVVPTVVEGWSRPAFTPADVSIPRTMHTRAVLSPFDPVVWHRPRAARLFGFDYRLEIYTPASQRRYGYYVLPFLVNDHLVARVDLKSDRTTGRLLVRTAWIEAAHDAAPHSDHIASELTAELETMAVWLGLDRGVDVADTTGDLAVRLRAVTRR